MNVQPLNIEITEKIKKIKDYLDTYGGLKDIAEKNGSIIAEFYKACIECNVLIISIARTIGKEAEIKKETDKLIDKANQYIRLSVMNLSPYAEILEKFKKSIATKNIQDAVVSFLEDFEKAVMDKLKQADQDSRHSALMGGIGISAGYHYHTKNFIFNLKAGVDYIGGTFKQTATQNAPTDKNPSLGWGVTLGVGVDHKFTPHVAMGIEGGVRISQFVLAKNTKKAEKTSFIFAAPYGQLNCTVFPSPKWSVGLFTGYIFPRQFKIDDKSGNIPYGTKCRIDGIYGGIKLSRYF